MKLSERLRLIRKQRKYTLKTLSEKTGLSVSYLSDMERGISSPSMESSDKIARVYNLDLSGLFTGVEINARA